jgi:hypothetical protein
MNYVECSKTACTARQGATATQLAERDAQLDTEQVVSGGLDAWRHAYNFLQYPGLLCDRRPYCWQDPDKKKHYKLIGYHLRSLVKFVQRGSKLETYSDILEDICTQLYAEEQQHLDRKRKRRDSDSSPAGYTPMIITTFQLILARPY